MQGFSESIRSAAEELEGIENERETAIAGSRRVIRLSKSTIHAIHVGEDFSEPASEMRGAVSDLLPAGSRRVDFGPVQDALMEYSEAAILASIVAEGRIPSFSEIGVPAGPWVLGLADSVGELRRIVTTRLMDGDMEGARRFFGIMEEISGEIMMLDVPDAVAPVRRKQDIVRGIMDRTRSDMTTASMMRI